MMKIGYPVVVVLGLWAVPCFAAEVVLTIEEEFWTWEPSDPPYTVGEVKALYGEADSVVTQEYGSVLVYTNKGLSFETYSEFDNTSQIREMAAKFPFRLKTNDGFVLGESTPCDVERIWGEIAWYGRADFPNYSFFRHHGVRFLVPRKHERLDVDKRNDTPVEKVMLLYSGLKRLQYVPPEPVEIKADKLALRQAADSIEDYLKQTFIEELDLDLEAFDDPDWHPLWDNFANRPYEKQFTRMTTEDWYGKRLRFEKALLERAREQKQNEVELQRILEAIRPMPNDRTAQIPVCAFRAKKGGEDIWIVITKWEYASMGGDRGFSSLGHIRMEVFRASDGERVDAMQCS